LEENYIDSFGDVSQARKNEAKNKGKIIPKGYTVRNPQLISQLKIEFEDMNKFSPLSTEFKTFLKQKLGITIK